MFKRAQFNVLKSRLREKRQFIQAIMGPRQVGKTTLVRQVLDALQLPAHSASADIPTLESNSWLESQWQTARLRCQNANAPTILVLDEVQKVPQWSTTVKRLWDEDTAHKIPLHVVMLGSSPLLIQDGLTESLAGRFETIPMSHWTYSEMSAAFGWSIDQFIYFGGYPGSAPLIDDEDRWRRYILDSLIETTLSRDIVLMTRIQKPALLRRLFQLGCTYSGQELSYQKVLGQLQESGNTTTLAHYLDLLSGAGMLRGLQKYAGQKIRQKSSSPKFQVYNTALMSALQDLPFSKVRENTDYWGRLVESAVGTQLLATATTTPMEVFYWRDGSQEVDFVIQNHKQLLGIEVKSGRNRGTWSGSQAFRDSFRNAKTMLVGTQGIPLKEFFSTPITAWL